MKLHFRILLISLLFLTVGSVHAQKGFTQVSLAEHKIVMQLTSSDPQVWKSLIKQLSNLKNGWKDSAMIEVVCHGPGLDFLTVGKSTVVDDISVLFQRGVSFVACENTMRERNVSRESILPNTNFVLMGIAEIVVKQEQGWAYIKAGF